MKRIAFLLAVMIVSISLCMTNVVFAATDNDSGYFTPGSNIPGNWPAPSASASSSEPEYEPEEEESYIIHAIAKTGGKIVHADSYGHHINTIDSQSFDVEVVIMDDCLFAIEPKEGYRILKVTVDGVDMGAIDHYEFEEVDCDHRIRATFTEISTAANPAPDTEEEEFNPNTGAL